MQNGCIRDLKNTIYPLVLLKKKPDLPQEYTPVFLDNKELSSGRLEKELCQALENSTWLVVLCSPASAISDYVDPEIRHFIESHKIRKDRNGKSQTRENRIEHIVPVIVSGIPYSNNSEEQCFPKKLIELKEDEGIDLLAVDGKRQMLTKNDINEDGWEKSFIRILSYMLEIPFDELWDRRTREIEEEQRKLKGHNDRLLIAQSRFVAEKAIDLIEKDNSYLAQRLLLAVIPKDLQNPNRPIVVEAEQALRKAKEHDTAILQNNSLYINSIAFNYDGKQFVTTSNDNQVKIWNVYSGALIYTLKSNGQQITNAIFSPDGSCIAALSATSVIIWKAKKGTEPLVFKPLTFYGYSKDFYYLEFSSDSKKLLTVSYDRAIRIWDVKTGEVLRTIIDKSGWISSANFSLDAKCIVSAHSSNKNWVWNQETNNLMIDIPNTQDVIVAEPIKNNDRQTEKRVDGSYLQFECLSFIKTDSLDDKDVSLFHTNVIKVWDVETGSIIQTFDDFHSEILSTAFVADGQQIISASRDGIRLWDFWKKCFHDTISKNYDKINNVAISNNGEHVVWVTNDNTIIKRGIFDNKMQVVKECSKPISTIAISPDGNYIVFAVDDNNIHILGNENSLLLNKIKAHTFFSYYVDVSPNGHLIATASGDKTVRLWDFKTGVRINTLTGHDDWVFSATFFNKGKRIVSASADNTIRVWDVKTGNLIETLRGHSRGINHVAYDPIYKRFASASDDNTIRIWDATSYKLIAELRGHVSPVKHVSFCPYGRFIVSASEDNTVRLWDVNSGKELRIIKEHLSLVNSASFSPDGNLVLSASNDNTICIWDLETNKKQILKGHTGPVIAATFSPNGKQIASASDDKTIYIWDTVTGNNVLVLNSNSSNVQSVAFFPDGRHLASIALDGIISIWDIPPFQKLIDQTHKRFKNNPLTLEERRQYYLEE